MGSCPSNSSPPIFHWPGAIQIAPPCGGPPAVVYKAPFVSERFESETKNAADFFARPLSFGKMCIITGSSWNAFTRAFAMLSMSAAEPSLTSVMAST